MDSNKIMVSTWNYFDIKCNATAEPYCCSIFVNYLLKCILSLFVVCPNFIGANKHIVGSLWNMSQWRVFVLKQLAVILGVACCVQELTKGSNTKSKISGLRKDPRPFSKCLFSVCLPHALFAIVLDACMMRTWCMLDACLMHAGCVLDACLMRASNMLDASLMRPWCVLDACLLMFNICFMCA